MDEQKRQREKAYVEAWKRAGPILEKMREEEIRATDTERDLQVFGGMMPYVLRDHPPGPTSGLVEMQRWFIPAARRRAADRGQA